MPNWGEHLIVANKLLKKINVDENLFLFGNILPDVQDGYLVEGISTVKPHKLNHYDLNGDHYVSNNKKEYDNFYDIYFEKMNNPIVIGYLVHLITDFTWNDMFYNKKCIKENGVSVGFIKKNGNIFKCTRKELREKKQKEFEIFQNYIYMNYDMKLPKFEYNVSRNANLLDNINLNDDDIKKVVEYINNTKNDACNKNQELHIFTIEELEKQIDYTVDFVLKFFKNKGIKI